MKYGLCDSRDDGEYGGSEETSEIFVTQDAFFYAIEHFDRIYLWNESMDEDIPLLKLELSRTSSTEY